MEFTTGQLEGPQYRNGALHTRHTVDLLVIDRAPIANDTDNRALLAFGKMDLASHLLHASRNVGDLCRRCSVLHNDNHLPSPTLASVTAPSHLHTSSTIGVVAAG